MILFFNTQFSLKKPNAIKKEGLTLLFLFNVPYLNVLGFAFHSRRSSKVSPAFYVKFHFSHMFNCILNQ